MWVWYEPNNLPIFYNQWGWPKSDVNSAPVATFDLRIFECSYQMDKSNEWNIELFSSFTTG